MADGESTRWNNYLGIPKHLIEIDGEPIIKRAIRLLNENDDGCKVIITSHNTEYEFPGSVRYEPISNVLEIDRFTKELVSDDICFLYGDTYYSEEAIQTIIHAVVEDVLFIGNKESIVAVKIRDGALFSKHVDNVRNLFLDGIIEKCAGWQVYQSLLALPFTEKVISSKFVLIKDETMDFNEPEDYMMRMVR